MNVEIGAEAAEFLFWDHINGIFVAVRMLVLLLQTVWCGQSQDSQQFVPLLQVLSSCQPRMQFLREN
jgi:hypothetical protein